MKDIKFYKSETIPLEMHKVRIVQKLNLIPVDEQLKAVNEAGNNTLNYHFTTSCAHVKVQDGNMLELYTDEAVKPESTYSFKGNMCIDCLSKTFKEHGKNISFVRMEAGTNLTGGQPFSLANLKDVHAACRSHGVPLVVGASLLSDNVHFIKVRGKEYKDWGTKDIYKEFANFCDIMYVSSRKLGHAKDGGIFTSDFNIYTKIRELVPLYEGFLTYGSMSTSEMEAIAVWPEESLDYDMLNQEPKFTEHMVRELKNNGVPVVTPSGGLDCHINAKEFVKTFLSRSTPPPLWLMRCTSSAE